MACARIQSGLAYDGDAPHSNTNSVIACNCLCCGLPALPGPSDCLEWSSKHPVLPWLLDLRPWYSALLGWWGVPQASFGQFATQSHKNLHPLVQGIYDVSETYLDGEKDTYVSDTKKNTVSEDPIRRYKSIRFGYVQIRDQIRRIFRYVQIRYRIRNRYVPRYGASFAT